MDADGEETVESCAAEVLSVVLGDAVEVRDLLSAPGKGVPYLLRMVGTLGFLAAQFPPSSEEIVELAEARTCRFCGASFIFAPDAPSCTACGAPAATASAMPPDPVAVIPDDPIEEPDPEDADDEAYRSRRIVKGRAHAEALAKLVGSPRIVEEPERARTFVRYTLDGREFRAKIMDEYVGIGTAAPGVKGDFYLKWTEQDVGGEKVADNFWHESERSIFFSRHCRVRSGHGSKEAARLASLPSVARAKLLELCEHFESGAQLEAERLALGLGLVLQKESVAAVAAASVELAKLADAFPRDFDDHDPVQFRLESCGHCGWAFFHEVGQGGCSHCGAPIAAKTPRT